MPDHVTGNTHKGRVRDLPTAPKRKKKKKGISEAGRQLALEILGNITSGAFTSRLPRRKIDK